MYRRILIFVFLVALFHEIALAEKLKLCVVQTANRNKTIHMYCPALNSPSSRVECVMGNDRFNCLRLVTTGTADFTILEPEDLIAAAAYKEYNVLVTNEMRIFTHDKQQFEMVVIVRKDVKNIWDIGGKRFCHPGLQNFANWAVTYDRSWTKAFSKFFEEMMIPKQCDQNKTLLENRLASLSNFFQSACIAGPWAADSAYDNKLKAKYKNLCASCDVPAACYVNDKYYGREGAVLCLTDNAGDIAWVRLDDALEHFKENRINKEDYNYLCMDSTTRPMALGKPCVWITKPWPVVVARSEIAEKVSKMLNNLMPTGNNWEVSLKGVFGNHWPVPVSSDPLQTPEDFLRTSPNFVSAYSRAPCRPSRRVQWCVVTNLEDRKCRWLREASAVYGIEPAISCIQEATRAACLKAIRENRADIFVVRPEELLEARKKGLKPIVHGLPKVADDLNRIAAVVKQDSRFESLIDLKGAKACFPGYKGVGWDAFASIVRNISGPDADCSDARSIGNFFKDSCVLGLNDTQKDVPRNLYSLCKQAGRAGDDISTFDCLSSGLGDVAIVNLKSIEKKTGKLTQIRNKGNNAEYRTLCVNGSQLTHRPVSSDDYFNRNTPCLLTWTSLCTVVGHENMTELRWEEIYAMLLEMDSMFGSQNNAPTLAFSMYGMYDANHSVIFPEGVQKLQLEDHRLSRVKSYPDIVNDIIKQAPCGSERNWCVSSLSTILLSVLVIALNEVFLA